MSKRVKIDGGFSENDDKVREPTDSPINHTSTLPLEMLAQIFSQLDIPDRSQVAQVCHIWRDAVYQKSLWRGAEFPYKYWHCSSEYSTLIPSLVQRGIGHVFLNNPDYLCLIRKESFLHDMATMRNVHFGCYHIISENHMFVGLLAEMPAITELKIENCLYSNRLWEQISQACPNLVSLYLKASPSFPSEFNELVTEIACVGLTQLKSLTIIYGLRLTDAWLKSISCSLLQLKSLKLTGCRMLTDAGIGYLCGCHPDTDPATSVHPALDTLDLSGCNKLTEIALEYLSRGQGCLKSLKITHATSVDGLGHLTKMGRLENLGLRLNGTGLKHLTRIKTLRQLRVSGWLSDDELAVLGQWTSVSLSLSITSDITKLGLEHLAKMSHLQDLKVTFMFDDRMYHLVRVLEGAPNITELNIDNCDMLLKDCLPRICRLTNLRRLKIWLDHDCESGFDLADQCLLKLDVFILEGVDKMREIKERRGRFSKSD